MDGFEKSEQLGRNIFSTIYPNYTKSFSQEKYAWWDVSGYTTNSTLSLTESQPYIAEIKVREDLNHNTHPTVMLEKKKYDKLINYTYQSGIPSFYFCIYQDKTLVSNLSNLDFDEIVLETKWLPKTSKKDDGYELKDVYYVPLNYFKKINKGYK